jgi:tetratricopeptide (TPR) repeat protein
VNGAVFCRAAAVAAGIALAGRGGVLAQTVPDPAAAEGQYRIAQRLAAEGDASAAPAFEKVIALDPKGALADDALLGLARLRRPPDWPEDVASLDAERAAGATAALVRLIDGHPDGDRAGEAHYLLALIRLAPLPGRDAGRARQDLIRVASTAPATAWSLRARYALGALDEQSGATERAAGSYARILLEHADSDAAPRARAGFARTLLRAGRFGEAAALLADAGPDVPEAAPLGQMALRANLRAADPSRRWAAVASPLTAMGTSRGASLMAVVPGGGIVVWDRKTEAIQSFDAKGKPGPSVPLQDATAIAVDPYGRVFFATKEGVFRLERSGVAKVMDAGAFSSAAALAVDAAGTLWIADRRGDRVARIVPGGAPQMVRDAKGGGIAALVASGGRVVAAEEKTGRLVSFAAGGGESAFGTAVYKRPVALAADAAGEIAVLDEKTETVTLLGPDGSVRDALSTATAGASRPTAIAFDGSGALRILDGSTGSVVDAP